MQITRPLVEIQPEESIVANYLNSPSVETLKPLVQAILETAPNPLDFPAERLFKLWACEEHGITLEEVQAIVNEFNPPEDP